MTDHTTRVTQALLPCPFCGGEAEKVGWTTTVIRCSNGQCVSRHDFGGFNDYGHEAEAIAAWNTRQAAEAEAGAREAALREALRRIQRTCEMSAGIMRDHRRTGGWEGAEKTADAFDRVARSAKAASEGASDA